MEPGFEGEDGQIGRTRGFIDHGGLDLGLAELDVCATSLLLTLPHKGSLVGKLVRVGTGLASEDLVEAFRGYRKDTGFEDISPVVLGEVTKGWSIDDSGGHFGRGSSEEEGWIIVAYWNRGNLGVYVEKHIAVKVGDVVSVAALVVGHHIQASCIEDFAESFDGFDALGAWD